MLREQDRPPVTFNRIMPVIKAVAGSEVNGRQDIQYLPREIGDATLNEVLTEAGRYLPQEADAEDEESNTFVDLSTCGISWVEIESPAEKAARIQAGQTAAKSPSAAVVPLRPR